MLKQITAALVATGLMMSSASATIIIRSGNEPTLLEINEGLQACKNGEKKYTEGGNCKYWNYPGQAHKTSGGMLIKPHDSNYILGDVLEPGTALPYVHDSAALLAAIKKGEEGRKVTIVSFYLREITWLASAAPELGNNNFTVAIPVEIAELAQQNNVTPQQMMGYIQEGIGQTPAEAIAEIQAQHNAIVTALNTQITALNTQIATLQQQINSLQTEHQAIVDALNAHIADLEANALQEALLNQQLKSDLEAQISANIQLQQQINAMTSQPEAITKDDVVAGNVGKNYNSTHHETVVINSGDGSGVDMSPIHGIDNGLGGTVTSTLQALGEDIYNEVMQSIADAIQDAYNAGYVDGYNDGYAAGYAAGYADGIAAK